MRAYQGGGLTLAVYDDLRVVTIRTHEHCFIVYLLFGQTGLSIHDFQQLNSPLVDAHFFQPLRNSETHSVSYAIRESHKLDLVLGALPVRVERQHKPQRRCLRVCMII